MIFKELEGCEASSLNEILDMKEERAAEIKRLGACYRGSVICFKLNIPGGIKNFLLAQRFFYIGTGIITKMLMQNNIVCLYQNIRRGKCGDTAFFVADADAHALKKMMCSVELNASGGRLYDIDVYTKQGVPCSRRDISAAERICLLCGAPAHACVRSREHSPESVMQKTIVLMKDALAVYNGEIIERTALSAMMKELQTTPKPGLVDRNNCGAHNDMNYALFEKSALAVAPYFRKMAHYAAGFGGPPEEMLSGLRPIGLCAEKVMFTATGGVNTHKGLIFSFGIICAAAAAICRDNGALDEETILLRAQTIARPALEEMGFSCDTNGQKIFMHHNLKGARGEAALGFPTVRNIGLPALKTALDAGESENDAGVITLLHLMAYLDDTNIISRSDIAELKRVQTSAKKLIAEKKPTKNFLCEVRKMDDRFIEKNISAGGCADMLAVCWLVYMLANQKDIR